MLSSSPWLSSLSGGGGLLLVTQKLGKEICTVSQRVTGSLAPFTGASRSCHEVTVPMLPHPPEQASQGRGAPSLAPVHFKKPAGSPGDPRGVLGLQENGTDVLVGRGPGQTPCGSRLRRHCLPQRPFAKHGTNVGLGFAGRMLLILDHSIFVRKDAFGFL